MGYIRHSGWGRGELSVCVVASALGGWVCAPSCWTSLTCAPPLLSLLEYPLPPPENGHCHDRWPSPRLAEGPGVSETECSPGGGAGPQGTPTSSRALRNWPRTQNPAPHFLPVTIPGWGVGHVGSSGPQFPHLCLGPVGRQDLPVATATSMTPQCRPGAIVPDLASDWRPETPLPLG